MGSVCCFLQRKNLAAERTSRAVKQACVPRFKLHCLWYGQDSPTCRNDVCECVAHLQDRRQQLGFPLCLQCCNLLLGVLGSLHKSAPSTKRLAQCGQVAMPHCEALQLLSLLLGCRPVSPASHCLVQEPVLMVNRGGRFEVPVPIRHVNSTSVSWCAHMSSCTCADCLLCHPSPQTLASLFALRTCVPLHILGQVTTAVYCPLR